MRVPPPCDREPTGRRRPRAAGMRVARVTGGGGPAPGGRLARFLKNSMGIHWQLGTPPGTRCKAVHGALGRRRPVGSRSLEEYPTSSELCESYTLKLRLTGMFFPVNHTWLLAIIRLTQQPDNPNASFAVFTDVRRVHSLCLG